MSITRAQSVTYLVGQYGSGANALLPLADVGLTDVSGGLKEPIDEALLLLAVTYGDLATATIGDADVPAYLAALRYTTLRRVLGGLNSKTNMDVDAGDGVALKGSQLVGKVERMLKVAAGDCQTLGLNVSVDGSGSSWASLGDLSGAVGYNLDFIEPEPVGA